MSTIIDVAKFSGVSIGTVSNFINGRAIREENKEKISKAIEELGFEPNSLARNFRTKVTQSIGVVVNTFDSIYNMTMLSEIEKYLKENGYIMIVTCSENNVENEREQIRALLDRYVDGLVIFPVSFNHSKYDDLIADNFPIVLVDHTINSFNFPCVLADNINASYLATEYLIKNGHTRIGVISGHMDASTAVERLTGFRRSNKDYNITIEEDLIKIGEYTKESGYIIAKELMLMKNPPTALYILSYDLLLGVMEALYEMQIEIPQQISILTYDYFEFTDLVKPRITAVKQPNNLMGMETGKIIIGLIKNSAVIKNCINRCKSELLIRESVKDINAI